MDGLDLFFEIFGRPKMFERHSHQCGDCKTIWTHDPPEGKISEAEYNARHNCPKCGKNQRTIYEGPPVQSIAQPTRGPKWPGAK